MVILMNNIRTIEEFKKDVFDKLDDNKKLEYMYQMGKQLCEIQDYVNSEIKRIQSHEYSTGIRMLNRIKKILGDNDE
jgi:hypothetical protein|nr:MAG TPA: hypothetical protein [Bacteriophage sp.]